MIRTVQRELSATSNVNAPKFNFKEYVRGQVYKNNSTDIDFVTDNGNLYVPVSDNVTANKNLAKEDNNFMLLVAKGEQGEQGVKGEKGADGRTPAVYARFDGKQMVFYTNVLDEDGNIVYNDNGTPATRRMAATNDLTGPSWKPELVNDTIVWHKTKEDEAPKSIPLSSLIKQTAPVLLRVDSDNTRRMDEMDESGPANYIQWKYEGDEHWNNLISISELMNLTLAGVSIWYDEEDGHYHFGHKEVEKASYAASHTGKQIITAVELGEILYDAGPIPLEDWSAQIAALHDYICQVEEKIPTDYVKSVNGKLPDDNGNVNVPLTDIKLQITPDKMLQISYDNGGTWSDVGRTCDCALGTYWTVTFDTPNPSNARMLCNDRLVRPGDTMQVKDGDTICIEATADNYNRFYECYNITSNRTFAPQLTPEVIPEIKYCAYVQNNSGYGTVYMGTTSDPSVQQASMCNLADRTRVYVKATRTGYNPITKNDRINGEDLYFTIEDSEWVKSSVPVSYVRIEEGDSYEMCYGASHTFTAYVNDDATDKRIRWSKSNDNAEITQSGKVTIVNNPTSTTSGAPSVTITATAMDGSNEYYDCVIALNDCSAPEHNTLELNPNSLTFDNTAGSKTFTVTTDADNYTVSETCDWVTTSKSGNTVTVTVTANTGTERYCDISVSAGDQEKTLRVTQEAKPKYTLTVNGNGAESITVKVNGTSHTYTRPMQIEEGATVIVSARRTNYEPSYDKNNFEMTKDTSVNITWEEVSHYVSVTSVTITNKPSNNIITWDCSSAQTKALGVTVLPNDATNHDSVAWSSSNEDVAIIQGDIQGGDILVKGVGTTVITVTGADDNEDHFTLTVKRPEITSFSLNKSVVNLEPEETETLRVDETSITPSCAETGTIDWTSDDPDVATVNSSSGKVTAVSEGTTTITARTPNGKTATCTVNVTNPPTYTYRIKVSGPSAIHTGECSDAGSVSAVLQRKSSTSSTWQKVQDIEIQNWNTNKPNVAEMGNTTYVCGRTITGTARITGTYTYNGQNYTDYFDITVSNPEPVVTPATVTVNFVNPHDGDGTVKVGNTTYEHGDSIEGYNVGDSFQYIASADGYETETGTHTITSADEIWNISLTESVPTTYTASVSAGSGCAPTSYTLTSSGVSVNNDSLSGLANGSTVTLVAKRTGYNDIQLSGTINNQNYVFNINCNDWVSTVVPVTSVVMDCHEGSIVVGDQITLSATVYPENATDKRIRWIQGSSPKGTISGNTFTATDTGVELISAQAGGVSSEQCGIVIDPRPVSVEGISIDSCPGTIAQGLTNVYLTATIDPSDATNKNVTWSSSNSNIIAVEQTNDGRGHLIVKNTAGTATITVTTEDGNYEASCTIVVPSAAIEFALGNQTSSGNKIYYTIGDNIDESEWSETWDSLNYGATTGTNPPLTISPGESLCITSENYPEDIQLEVNGTNRDDTNGFITMTYSELQQAAGYSNTYIVTFVREH